MAKVSFWWDDNVQYKSHCSAEEGHRGADKCRDRNDENRFVDHHGGDPGMDLKWGSHGFSRSIGETVCSQPKKIKK